MVGHRRDRFAAIAEGYDALVHATSGERYAVVLDALAPTTSRALDAGCGSGVLALRLARDVRHVVGIDVSPSMLALAARGRAEAGASNVTLLAADLGQPPFADRSFDLVVGCYALHDVRLEQALAALRRLVRPGGRMVILDLVSRWPRLRALRAWRLWSAAVGGPGLLRRHGPRLGGRLWAFRLRRAWREPHGPWVRPTPAAFRETCGRWLPGCRILRPNAWAMAAVWQAPASSGAS